MPDLTSLNEFTGTALGVGAFVALIAGWVKVIHPKWQAFWRRVTQFIDAIVGREAIVHPDTGTELVPAQPGIAVRLMDQEQHLRDQGQQMEILTNAVAKIADSHERLEHHAARLDQHDVDIKDLSADIKELKEATVERVVTKAESAAAWRAMEAAALATPDVTIEPEPDDQP